MTVATDSVNISADQQASQQYRTQMNPNLPESANPSSPNNAMRSRAVQDDETIQYMMKMMAEEYRIAQVGIPPTTILNMNPWPLKINSTMLDDVVIPPCPNGRPYAIYVLRQVRFSRKDEVDGLDNPVPYYPIQQARAFNEAHYNKGGVVIYTSNIDLGITGDGEKQDPAIAAKKDPSLQRNLDEARARQLTYMREQVGEATGWDRSPNSNEKKAINNRHRDMAMLLHDITGEELPSWVSKEPGKFGLGEKCPRCQTIPASSAYMCAHCGNILDARKAYTQGDITVSDASLQKLDRSILVEMGISELIAQTIAERNADDLELAKLSRKSAKK